MHILVCSFHDPQAALETTVLCVLQLQQFIYDSCSALLPYVERVFQVITPSFREKNKQKWKNSSYKVEICRFHEFFVGRLDVCSAEITINYEWLKRSCGPNCKYCYVRDLNFFLYVVPKFYGHIVYFNFCLILCTYFARTYF